MVEGMRVAVGSVGRNFLCLREGLELPAGASGTLQLLVDHVPWSIQVILPSGAVPFDLKIPFERHRPKRFSQLTLF